MTILNNQAMYAQFPCRNSLANLIFTLGLAFQNICNCVKIGWSTAKAWFYMTIVRARWNLGGTVIQIQNTQIKQTGVCWFLRLFRRNQIFDVVNVLWSSLEQTQKLCVILPTNRSSNQSFSLRSLEIALRKKAPEIWHTQNYQRSRSGVAYSYRLCTLCRSHCMGRIRMHIHKHTIGHFNVGKFMVCLHFHYFQFDASRQKGDQ